MDGQTQIFDWSFSLKSGYKQIWPFISDTNRLFKKLGATSIQETNLSRSTPKGFLELSHNKIRSYAIWKEEPYLWEAPFRYSVKRHYKTGLIKTLNIRVNLIPASEGTRVNVKLQIIPSGRILAVPVRFFVDKIIRRRLQKFLLETDDCIQKEIKPYEISKEKRLHFGAGTRIGELKNELVKVSRRQRIVNRLIEYLQKAEDDELERIHPYALAEYWGEKKYSVLNVFLHATNLELLDFKWDVCCPGCKSPRHSFQKLKETRIHLFCEECDEEYSMDFNKNTHLVFTPHPLIRKLNEKRYCLGGPGTKPHRVSQHFLDLADDRYTQLKLEEGTYYFKTYHRKGYLKLHARDDGPENITLYITDDDLNGQEATISTRPNLIISNRSSEKALCFIEKANWKQEAIYASEVSSSLDFRTLFASETLKESAKVKASDVTMLFTDLMNSTEIYLQEGDEMAIGRVMSHFKIIQQIVAEERGGIVKTIGDSVMAVFREPVSALKAVQRIQQIFTTSTSLGDAFKLKAGVHFGDCTAVNLNGRIDYFGTTVNIASRLVDVANEKEIMISESVFKHPDVQLFLDKQKETFFVKESLKELKGFEDEEFKVKQIRLERPPMRLVI